MIQIVSNEKQIVKYQKLFVRRLKEICKEKVVCLVGHQGESHEVAVYYSADYNFWFRSIENDNRYWNAFGFGRPLKGKNNSITVEINIPYEGINRNVGGVFATL